MKKFNAKQINCYMPKTTAEWLELIYDISIDYDGCNTIESLKELIDEMREYTINARKALEVKD